MIVIMTDTDTHKFDAKPEEVTNSGGSLKIIRNGQTLCHFRKWNNWFHTDKD